MSDMLQGILGSVLRVLLHSLALNQSTSVLQHMFAMQRSLVSKVQNVFLVKVIFQEILCLLCF